MTGREATCGHQVATRLTGGALFSCDRETGHDGDHAAAFTVCEWAGGDSRFPARVTWAVSTPARESS